MIQIAANMLDAAIQSAVPCRARVEIDAGEILVRVPEFDARELAEALELVGVPDCGGVESCAWASIGTNLGHVEELAAQAHDLALELPLWDLLRARARRRIRRLASIGASS